MGPEKKKYVNSADGDRSKWSKEALSPDVRNNHEIHEINDIPTARVGHWEVLSKTLSRVV
jgi:hypothetical protein